MSDYDERRELHDALRRYVEDRGPDGTIRLWTSGGYVSGTFVEMDMLTIQLFCHVNGAKSTSVVHVVLSSISSWG